MSKKVRMLEMELFQKNHEIRKLNQQVDMLAHRFETMEKLLDNTPEDCKSGKYCRACAFSIALGVRIDGEFRAQYFCNKNGACKNFVPKELEDWRGEMK